MPFIAIAISFLAYTFYKTFELSNGDWQIALPASVVIFATMFLTLFLPRRASHSFKKVWFKALIWPLTTFFGIWTSYLFISIPFDIFKAVVTLAGFNGFEVLNSSQGSWIILLISAVLALIGFFIAAYSFKIKNVNISDPRVKGKIKIAQISDLHLGPTIEDEFVARVEKHLIENKPDVIVLTGDIIDARLESVRASLERLIKWQSIAPLYYVTGNHEYYWGAEDLISELKAGGVKVLLNQNEILKEHNIVIVGVTDPTGKILGGAHRPNISDACRGITENTFNVLLAHQPLFFEQAFENKINLMLSGHTHGGQYFPFSLLIGLFHKYSKGLYSHRDRLWVYVHSGTGYWGPRHRLGSLPEIALINLSQPIGS